MFTLFIGIFGDIIVFILITRRRPSSIKWAVDVTTAVDELHPRLRYPYAVKKKDEESLEGVQDNEEELGEGNQHFVSDVDQESKQPG